MGMKIRKLSAIVSAVGAGIGGYCLWWICSGGTCGCARRSTICRSATVPRLLLTASAAYRARRSGNSRPSHACSGGTRTDYACSTGIGFASYHCTRSYRGTCASGPCTCCPCRDGATTGNAVAAAFESRFAWAGRAAAIRRRTSRRTAGRDDIRGLRADRVRAYG